jgi:hypothetical protein
VIATAWTTYTQVTGKFEEIKPQVPADLATKLATFRKTCRKKAKVGGVSRLASSGLAAQKKTQPDAFFMSYDSHAWRIGLARRMAVRLTIALMKLAAGADVSSDFAKNQTGIGVPSNSGPARLLFKQRPGVANTRMVLPPWYWSLMNSMVWPSILKALTAHP